MRKLVSYHVLSVDGIATSPERWVFDHFDAEMMEHLTAPIAGQDAVVLGRVTYQEWESHWPTSDNEPFATFINTTGKHVAATTLDEVGWNNSTLIEGDVVEYVADLKRRNGKEIGLHGSIGLTRSLLRADSIDELRLAVLPVIAGSGRRLFDDTGETRRLRLAAVKQTTAGSMLLTYRPR